MVTWARSAAGFVSAACLSVCCREGFTWSVGLMTGWLTTVVKRRKLKCANGSMLVVEDGLRRRRTGLRTLKAKQSPINFLLLSFRIEQAGLERSHFASISQFNAVFMALLPLLHSASFSTPSQFIWSFSFPFFYSIFHLMFAEMQAFPQERKIERRNKARTRTWTQSPSFRFLSLRTVLFSSLHTYIHTYIHRV